VHALREATGESLHAMRSLPPADQREAAAELGRKLQSKADDLAKEISHARRWKLAAPGIAGAAGGIAATAAVAIGAAGPTAGLSIS
jgi:glycerate kinase